MLHLPAGTTVCSDLDYSKHFRLKEDQAVGLNEIDSVFEVWRRSSPDDPRMDTSIAARYSRALAVVGSRYPAGRHWLMYCCTQCTSPSGAVMPLRWGGMSMLLAR